MRRSLKPRLLKLDDALRSKLGEVSGNLSEPYEFQADEAGEPVTVSILRALRTHGPMTSLGLAEHVDAHIGTIRSAADGLRKRKYLTTRTVPHRNGVRNEYTAIPGLGMPKKGKRRGT